MNIFSSIRSVWRRPSRIHWIAFTIAFSLFPATALNAEKPNVILIMTDDQGFGDFGATGNSVIETPNLDRMAKNSASMSQFYVSPVCSPTRASLMTGRYNYRTKCIDTWVGRSMMDPREVTVAELLQEGGYRTGIFGKWHLGDCYPMRPQDQGFDVSLIHKGGGLAQPSEPLENRRRYTDPILFRNGRQVKTRGYCTDVYFDEAMSFIKKSKESKSPFFAYIATNAPHGPFHDVPKELYEHYLKKPDELQSLFRNSPAMVKQEVDRLARISAMITNVDQNVGRLFEMLEREKLLRNTLVIFLVDNGPNSMRYVGKSRGMKSNIHEGGIRSPIWFHWPAQLKAGDSASQVSAHIDLLPTILGACDIKPPKDLKLDGRSLLPLLKKSKVEWPERHLVIQTHRGDVPVRYHHFMIRDSRFKLLHASGFGRQSFEGKPKFELYDLKADPGETKNLVDSQPVVVKRLLKAYDDWFDDVTTTRPNNFAPPRIVIGSVHEPETVLTRQDWRANSWGAGSYGRWLVRLDQNLKMDIQVILQKPMPGKTIVLNCGNQTFKSTLPEGKNSIEFSQVELSKGEFSIASHIEIEGKNVGAYQVILRKRK